MGNKKNKKDIESMNQVREKLTVQEKKKVCILELISIILAVIIEFIFVNTGKNISITRVITLFGIISFIGLHFIIGFKKLYTIIVENRFIISGIMIIVSTIIGYFNNQIGIKEWILNTNTVLSLWWNIKFYGLLLVSYELFSLLTDKSKGYSIIGTIVVVFSGAVQWNFDKIDSLILGELVVVLLDKLLKEEKIAKKLIFAICIFSSIIAYVFTFEGYAISFAYVFIALIIWIFIRNKHLLKDKKNLIICLTTFIISILCATLAKSITQVHYNDVIENEVKGISYLYSYLYNMFLPFHDLTINSLFGSFLSGFPLPMFLALYYMFKNEDNVEFLLPITIVSVIETVFCMSGLPDIVNKISLLSNVSLARCVPAVNLANVYILFYTIKHIDKKMFSISAAIRISIVAMLIVGFIGYPENFNSRAFLNVFMIESCLLSFLYLIFHDKNYKNVLLFFLCVITLIGGLTVNPIILL